MRLALSALALLTSHSLAAGVPLRFAITESWDMPLARIEQGQPTAGILYDMMESLAHQVGSPAEFRVMARLRLQSAMKNGDIDVRCYTAEVWQPNHSNDYLWSLPLVPQRDLLVAAPGDNTPIRPEQLPKQKIGTVLGYTYDTLQSLFDEGRLKRDDAHNQRLVLKKLKAGRYRYAVSNQLSLNWFNRQLPPQQQLQTVAVLEEKTLSCYVRNDPSLPVQQILQTLLKMKMSGEIDEIIARYSSASVSPHTPNP